MDTVNNTYPDFHFTASELSAFAVGTDMFTISLKSGEIIHFIPDKPSCFHQWLSMHGVRDIAKEPPVERNLSEQKTENILKLLTNRIVKLFRL